MKKLFFIIFVLNVSIGIAQNKHKIDSLNNLLKQTIHDTVRAEIYYKLAGEYWEFSPDKATYDANLNTAIDYAKKCLTLSERIGYKRGIGNGYQRIAGIYDDQGIKSKAIELSKKALKVRLEDGDEERISNSLFTLGYLYQNIGDYEQALKYNFECLTYDERRGDSAEAAGVYHNNGMIYNEAGNRKEAISNTKKALHINEKTGNKNWLGLNCMALGDYYSASGEGSYQESLKYFQRAVEVFLSIGQKNMHGLALANIGAQLSYLKRYPEAIDSLNRALTVCRSIHDKNGMAWSYIHLGTSYTQQRKFKEAAVCLDSALRLCSDGLGVVAMRNVYKPLYKLDSASGNLAAAYKHYQLYINLRDSINSIEKVQNVAKQQLQIDFAKKEEQVKAEQEKKDVEQRIIRNAILGGLVGSVAFLFVVYRQRNKVKAEKKNVEVEKENVEKERERSEVLLLNILPAEVAEELKTKGTADAKLFDNVTVLFTDFKSFTNVSEQLSPQELVNELHTCFKAFDEICTKYNIEKIKTIGDAYLAVCGLPLSDEKHADNVVNAALEIREFMEKRRQNLGEKTFEVRIGINSGSVVAGIVGVKKFAYDIWGDTVNTAARMEQNSEAGKINISETTYALVKDSFTCEYRGEIDAKNKGKLKMYFVEIPVEV